jgi:hypothetical protein
MTLEMGLKQNLTAEAKLGWESFYQQFEPQLTHYVFTGNNAPKLNEEDDDAEIMIND